MPWQFEFGFVPSASLTRYRAFSQPSPRILKGDRAGLWDGIAFPDSLIESLDRLLPDFCLIDASQMRWGQGSASVIDVFVEGDRLVDVSVALDLRVPCLKFVSDLTLVANRHDWLVITADGTIFWPTVRQFLVAIQYFSGHAMDQRGRGLFLASSNDSQERYFIGPLQTPDRISR